jgi:alpha-N-arabinofuranosidase
MDQYDPEKSKGLIVDEWGNWHDVEPGTNPGFLYQQNTLRDALVAAVNLNIFNQHCDRVKMANIAQTVNVLQSVILTNGDQLVRTPTFYVFKMYKVHHDALLVPSRTTSEDYALEGQSIPALHASCSKAANGILQLTVANLNPNRGTNVECVIEGSGTVEVRDVEIITAGSMNAFNDFGEPETVVSRPFDDVYAEGNKLTINMPPRSIIYVAMR